MKLGEKADRGTEEPEGDSAAVEELTKPEAVERRVWRNAFVVILLAVLASVVFASLKVTLGLALGCVLALVNFKWLHSSVRGILSAGTSTTPPGTMFLFIIRWIIVGTAAYFAIQTGYFNGIAVLAGLFAPAAAVMIEAGYLFYKSFIRRGEDR